MTKQVSITVIIATFNRRDLLRKTLLSLKKQNKPNNIDLNIILVIDGSTDNTVTMIESDFPEVKMVMGDGNWWWTKSMNAGFKEAIKLDTDYILILNDDVEIKENYLKTLFDNYLTLPQGSILGSASVSISKPHKIESAGTKEFIKWRLKYKPYFKAFQLVDENFTGIHKTFTLSGRGTFIPSQVFNKIGLYDENLIQYGSDDEFCMRAVLNKIPIFISWDARIYNNTFCTSKGTTFKKEGILTVLKSFFDKYSVNSLRKNSYLYFKYGYKFLLPIYLMSVILGTIKSYYFNYNK